MLFGQCPNRGGDLLKGASLRLGWSLFECTEKKTETEQFLMAKSTFEPNSG